MSGFLISGALYCGPIRRLRFGLLPSMQKKFDHAISHSLRSGVFCGSFADDVSITSADGGVPGVAVEVVVGPDHRVRETERTVRELPAERSSLLARAGPLRRCRSRKRQSAF